MSVIPVLVARRKKLLKHLEKLNANTVETAKTADEILAEWKHGPIEALRRHALENDLNFFILRKKLAVTADGKYYLQKNLKVV